MDVASPLTVRTAARTSLGFEGSTFFTLARKFIMLATRAANWHYDGVTYRYRGSHHPSATGDGHRSP
ncbi:MAG TPA: hypothetical protein VFJ06_01140 [Halococcus sp.]|nr:hypothetical protein [Halococcus sp.]